MPRLVDEFDSVLLDLDGVVYLGPAPVAHAADVIERLSEDEIPLAFVTNNSSRTPEQVVQALQRVAVHAQPNQIVGSAYVAASVLAQRVPIGSPVFVVGGDGLVVALRESGLVPTRSLADDPVAVVQGFHPDVGWRQLADAAFAVQRGAYWIASNADVTLPTDKGLAPGNGSLVNAVAAATGTTPEVVGKPFKPAIVEALRRLGTSRPILVGDRLDTDIEAGYNSGQDTLLVMTGVATIEQLCQATPTQRPAYIGRDLRALVEPYESVRVEGGNFLCDAWTLNLGETGVRVVERGSDAVCGLRALAEACWVVHGQEWSNDTQAAVRSISEAFVQDDCS